MTFFADMHLKVLKQLVIGHTKVLWRVLFLKVSNMFLLIQHRIYPFLRWWRIIKLIFCRCLFPLAFTYSQIASSSRWSSIGSHSQPHIWMKGYLVSIATHKNFKEHAWRFKNIKKYTEFLNWRAACRKYHCFHISHLSLL